MLKKFSSWVERKIISMEILSYDPKSLKDVIDEGKLISEAGFSGAVFLHGSNLIKLDQRLYHYLKINSKTFANSVFKDRYLFDKEPFVAREQIEYLQSKQKNVRLTEFDKGIVLVKDRICGVILEPHLDYHDLTNSKIENPRTILKILRNILAAIRELELNEISHLDLAKGEKGKEPTLNILHKDENIKLCDLSGKYITYGDKFNPQAMYQEYAMVIRILLKKIKDKFPNYLSLVNELGLESLVNYDQAEDALDVLNEFTR